MSVQNVSDSPSVLPQPSGEQGIKDLRIEKVTKKVFLGVVLTTAAVNLATAVVSIVVASQAALMVSIISTVALSLLLVGFCLHISRAHLPKALQKVVKAVDSFAFDCFSIVASTFVLPLAILRSHTPKEVDSKQPAILFVHGYFHNASGWTWGIRRLKHAGFKNIFTINLGSFLHKVDRDTKQLKEKIEEIKNLTGRKRVILVGHSRGGLLAANYTRLHSEDVERVYTLGAPLRGVHVANIGFPASAKEMQIQSKAREQFIEKVPGDDRFHHFASEKGDWVILPWRSAYLEDNKKNTTFFPRLGHLSYFFHDPIYDRIIQDLQCAEPA